ncbi:MAG TPA: ParB/RepB/Spo0J family partition protein [Methylomusa anaerophila]|nr:ParB/RepB/Spo0J family partition protein [Methylomusa anaerophila]HML88913.1 ParB/RepB/Spo0J family partition protein [Methylomusa anaerophila]
MITNIKIDRISPHPDNPRKDLGDLSELAESIKANGILQNLTVVPWFSEITRAPADDGKMDGHYRVIIGHRRLAAAKLAGLTEVPCVIADMDPKNQVATMLLENMQRNDLTIWEQAQGFQMMLDFGETIGDIAKQTGFSYSTISRRVKLMDLDKDKFQQSVDRGATLQDYAELDKIGDVKLKNSVLESIGTSNFQWKLKQAINQEKQEKGKAALIAELETFATRVQKTDGLRQVQWFSVYSGTKVIKPADAGETRYFFTDNSYNIILYKESSGNEPGCSAGPSAAGPSAEEQKQLQERCQQLDELHKQAYELRGEFVKNYAGRQKDARNIMSFALEAMLLGDIGYGYSTYLGKKLGIEIPEPEDEDDDRDEDDIACEAIAEAFEALPEKVLFTAAYCGLEKERTRYYGWQCKYEGNAALDAIYDALEKIGYEISEEERALRDGTHELYVRDKE